MPDYKNSKIYKITAGNLTYYGSTTQSLSKRLAKHRDNKLRYPQKNTSCYILLDMPDCKIILVEDYPCERREQLLAREAYYIEHNNCVNKCRPILTEEQRKEAKKQEKIRYFTKYPNKCPEGLRKYYNITNPEQEQIPNPEPVKSSSSRYRERQQRLKLIQQGKITFENI